MAVQLDDTGNEGQGYCIEDIKRKNNRYNSYYEKRLEINRMNLSWVDWGIVGVFFVVVTSLALGAKRYTRSVADFLAANRCGGRYLLALAGGMTSLGAISIIALWEMYYEAGFTPAWWNMMLLPVAIIIAASGWVIYRYRQTRAMTLAQLFEIRYSRKFRVFAGIVGFIGGIINFGLFPAVGSRFFIYFCGLPQAFTIYGFEISTFAAIMLLLIATSFFYTCIGGQIAVILTDFFQGIFVNIVFVAILTFCLISIDWSKIADVFAASQAEHSMINPMHSSGHENFNVWFFLIAIVVSFYQGPLAWQGAQGYNCSAKSAHEAKMAGIMGTWRTVAIQLLPMIVPVVAFVIMNHLYYNTIASSVNQVLGSIDNVNVRRQMTVPLVMSRILPAGLKGALCGAMLAAFISTHDTYMHSWGSIFIQDVIMPFRKKPFEPGRHMLLLRLSILGVAVFIFCFSLVFRQTGAILMFFALTGAIFIGGAGAPIIGGLYWKKGATAGAWGSMITGASLAVTGFVLRQIWPSIYGKNFPLHGQWIFLITIVSSSAVYVVLSLLKNKIYNIDRMLHRGKYAIEQQPVEEAAPTAAEPREPGIKAFLVRFMKKMGLSKEFTRGDRIVLYLTLFWNLGWFVIFCVGTAYSSVVEVSDESWLKYWQVYVGIIFVLSIASTVWFLLGGIKDLKYMFTTLSTLVRNHRDDGMVIDHQNRDEDIQENELATAPNEKDGRTGAN